MKMSINLLEDNKKENYSIIEIKGEISEAADFKTALNFKLQKTIIIKCPDITKINSTGVKRWISFFQDLSNKGHRLIFQSMSQYLVDQANQVADFLINGEVYSFFIPFVCKESHCIEGKKEFYIEAELSSVVNKINFDADDEFEKFPIKVKCPHCGLKNTEFTDFVDEYFNFIKLNKKQKQVA